MPKALTFKGDKKSKKRKRAVADDDETAPASRQIQSTDAAEGADDEDTWVSAETISDITGPIMFICSTKDPVTCLATDAIGKVHASPVENMIEGDARSAEPHLVSQVWIATKVVGSEDQFTLKGHHGRYLGCDQYGYPSAMREAVSAEETFKLSLCEEKEGALGCFDMRTVLRGQYLSVDESKSPPEVRGDAEEPGPKTRLRVRMQAKFKPKHKVEKAEKVRSKISRKELETEVGRRLEDHEVKRLKKARKEGDYHEAMLDVKVKGKHDKFA